MDRLAMAYIRRKKWEADLTAAAVWGGFAGASTGKSEQPRQNKKPVQWISQTDMMKMMGFDPGRLH